MSAAAFEKLANSHKHSPPPTGGPQYALPGRAARCRCATRTRRGRAAGTRADPLREREFWSAIGNNPPLYGADNPVSFFDKRPAWGWTLHDLKDLLHLCKVPEIPGVTTPMTYFGMWKVRAATLHSAELRAPSPSASSCGALCPRPAGGAAVGA